MTGRETLLIAGNWKMNKTAAQTRAFCVSLRERLAAPEGVFVAVCPPTTSLAEAALTLDGSHIEVYAQNVHWDSHGAFTGEVSAEMLLELGVVGSLVGHSERRQLFGETDERVALRVEYALEAGLEVIACVGEQEHEREAGMTEEVLRRQVTAIGEVVGEAFGLVLAYEPVWAIGTGRTATPEQVQQAHAFIRQLLDVPVLYGGSVKPENAAELLAQPDVDGALLGGASLELDPFLSVCETAASEVKGGG